MKKWPYWLKWAMAVGTLGAAFISVLPDDIFNLASAPWCLAWVVLPAFLIFAVICILFRVDFVSNSDNVAHITLLGAINILSYFVVFFLIGSALGLIVGMIRSRRA